MSIINKIKDRKKEQIDLGLKKEMKQSKLIFLHNMGSVFCLLLILTFQILTSIVSQNADQANRERYILSECTTHFITASTRLTSLIRAYASTGDKLHYDDYLTELEQTKTREKSIAKIKELGVSEKEMEMINSMMSLSDSLVPLEIKAIEYVAADKSKEALETVLGVDYNNTLLRMQEQKLEFLNSLSVRTTSEVNGLIAMTRVMESLTLLITILVIALQIRMYFTLRKKVIKPIIEVEREMRNLAMGKLSEEFNCQPNTSEIGIMIESIIAMKRQLKKYIDDISEKLLRMSEKDMTIRIEIDYIGDFTPIKKAMSKIIYTMNTIINQMLETADQVEVNAKEVANEAMIIASGTQQQAASMAEISDTMVSISNLAENSVSQADMANKLANMAGEQLSKSNAQLQEMLDAMRKINDASDEIGKIVKTIEDISAQTNLIALNASVEAAKAGDAGKGFAIVAQEVRELASKSAVASKSTSNMIQNSLMTIRDGVEIAQSASDTFMEVMVNAGKAAEAMGSISQSCKKQFTSISGLTQNMEEIASVSQSYSAASEKSVTVSEELYSKAESLHHVVNEFHLKKKRGFKKY